MVDIFGAANNVAGLTYRYNEPYTAAALILLAVSLIAAYFVRKLEGRFPSATDLRRGAERV